MIPEEKPHHPFNEDFCIYLEYHLSKTFRNFEDNEIRRFWCDGVAMPFVDEQLMAKSVNDIRKIITKAWIGADGQGEYEMTINFGPKALSWYARGLDLKECVPSEESLDWITFARDEKKIELRIL
ncbi:hypothetical protein FHW88_003238 [Mucilaginibacter sp. SG538B]|uniref:hypothetical protein n=1 Tax=Mucilaginibacter TaxID=423349 RepID=UPI00087194AC|nr:MULTISPECIES: hypothetical protein [unclassified Mucilaginibacter]NVM64949.1 hypothetical protein [Mucilaginibacter sp. SG538B]SCW86549.1 hypothetical protein SAMN03159284_05128 [Mucilaginibacter sp. NFR10]